MDGYESGLTEAASVSDSLMQAFNGRPTARSRAEIATRFVEGPAADTIAAYVKACVQGAEFTKVTILEFADAVRNRETVSLDLAARIGVCATTHPYNRDALIGVVAISADAAGNAFTSAAAHLRGNARVQMLTLAGLAAYVSGNGTVASIAFHTAADINVDANHTGLLKMLDKSLHMGLLPENIADLVGMGIEIAESMGINLIADDTAS
jgi:hypothetical protein